MLAAMTALLVSCGGSGVTTSTAATNTATVITAASLSLSASATSIPSNNTNPTTITVTALSATNAVVPGVVVTLAADTGILSAQTVTTGPSGTATFTFSSGLTTQANRTATITATAGATAQIPIQIVGSTLKWVSTSATTIPNDGSVTSTVVFQVMNGTAVVAGSPYTAAWSGGTGQVSVSPTSGVTDSNGNITLTVKGVTGTSGTANVAATAVGSTVSTSLTVSPASSTFAITNATDNTTGVSTPNPTVVAMYTSDTLTVTASAPSTVTSVTFFTSVGGWVSGTATPTSLTVPVLNGTASATLTGQQAGTTNITAAANTGASANLKVSVTATTPYSITLQASPTTVIKGGVSTLIATVKDASGNPVGNATVGFSMSNTTGGGESISPVTALTAAIPTAGLALGQASATFTAGTVSSSAAGVQVHAYVGTVATYPNNVPYLSTYVPNPGPSGNDASIIIGGTAGSIAFGVATQIIDAGQGSTIYQQPMSILVSDAGGNPVQSATVTLSVWPSAWSTGGTVFPCTYDADPATPGTTGTFVNEDINGNMNLDAGEDGYRRYLASGKWAGGTNAVTGPNGLKIGGGSQDGQLTPVNSDGGSVPRTVTTDINGVANFNLTYLKSNAIWTIDTIRASTQVQGSSTVSQTSFRLMGSDTDVKANPCVLGNNGASPYNF